MRMPDMKELAFVLNQMCIDAPHAGAISTETWHDFLRFANLLWLADAPVEIGTSDDANDADVAGVADEAAETADAEAAGGAEAADGVLAPAWSEAILEFDGDEDASGVVKALRLLARSGAEATEDIGEEVGSLPTAVSWPHRKIALLMERDESYASAEAALREAGWTLLYPATLDEHSIPAALLGSAG